MCIPLTVFSFYVKQMLLIVSYYNFVKATETDRRLYYSLALMPIERPAAYFRLLPCKFQVIQALRTEYSRCILHCCQKRLPIQIFYVTKLPYDYLAIGPFVL